MLSASAKEKDAGQKPYITAHLIPQLILYSFREISDIFSVLALFGAPL